MALGDGPAMAAAYRRNREHLAATSPDRSADYYTDEAQAALVAQQVQEAEEGHGYAYVVTCAEQVVGRVALAHLVRGPLQGATLSYWTDADHQGRGLAREMSEYAAERAREMGLHRLEAGTLLDNIASQMVLKRAGFTEIGIAEKLLWIRGEWRDHLMFQRILHDQAPSA